jgi:hypothetical protein
MTVFSSESVSSHRRSPPYRRFLFAFFILLAPDASAQDHETIDWDDLKPFYQASYCGPLSLKYAGLVLQNASYSVDDLAEALNLELPVGCTLADLERVADRLGLHPRALKLEKKEHWADIFRDRENAQVAVIHTLSNHFLIADRMTPDGEIRLVDYPYKIVHRDVAEVTSQCTGYVLLLSAEDIDRESPNAVWRFFAGMTWVGALGCGALLRLSSSSQPK